MSYEKLPTPNQLLIWALTDGRPGNDNQTLAVAEKIGPYEIKHISFSKLAELPNCLLGTCSTGIVTKLEAPYPDIVVAAGRKLSRVARIIKKRSPKTKTIQLMWPGYGADKFDLIFAPKHDKLSPRSNLIETAGSPNRITAELINNEAEKWSERIPPSEKTAVAVLVGKISMEESDRLIHMLNTSGVYPLITTSRRTPADVVENFRKKLEGDRYLYEWKPQSDNPYLAFLGKAEYIIATGDSLSMIAESATTGKPLYIFECDAPQKHKSFISQLYTSGHARKLDGSLGEFSYLPLNTLEFVAGEIKSKLAPLS